MKKYVFGPVPSRRLGLSLGIDLTPAKTCSLNCRYCQLTPTKSLTIERAEYCPTEAVLKELKTVLAKIETPDWITFSGTGEPTLHRGIGEIIREIKTMTSLPICVITNGTLLYQKEVRTELLPADRILPTLSTVFEKTFEKIHRPSQDLQFPDILAGITALSGEYPGTLEIEVFVCPGINDSPEEINGLSTFFSGLPHLNGVYLNTSVRQPLESDIRAASADDLFRFKEALNLPVPVSTAYDSRESSERTSLARATFDDILSLLKRHPCTTEQLGKALGGSKETMQKSLARLLEQGKIEQNTDGTWIQKK